MEAKVIKTTDWKYLWQTYEVDSLDVSKVNEATWNKFDFNEIRVKWGLITLKNSNYTAVLRIL